MKPEPIRITLARFEETLNGVKKDTGEIHKTLYGNGTPGLKTDVDRLKISDAERKRKLNIIIGGLITLGAGLGAKILYDFLIFGKELSQVLQHLPK